MVEVNDMYTLLIRGEGLTEAEIGQLREVEAQLGREKLFQLISKKKILKPFRLRMRKNTLYQCKNIMMVFYMILEKSFLVFCM